jgi:peptidoglycan/xylan/chitin deacetylase (PgdA/CDA1 family)
MSRVAVLTYHAIGPGESILSVKPEDFRKHVESIARAGRPVVSPSRLAGAFEESPPVEDGSFAFTFDDGYTGVADHAAPILESFGFPYAIFLVTSRVGRDNDWPGQPAWVERAPLLDWGRIEKLAASGAEIGAHTASHADLSRMSESEARDEIEESRAEIARRLGVSPRIFAYPGGRCGGPARRIAGSLFDACFGTRHARMRESDERAEIPRIETFYFREPAGFRRLLSPDLDARLALRRALRRIRRIV